MLKPPTGDELPARGFDPGQETYQAPAGSAVEVRPRPRPAAHTALPRPAAAGDVRQGRAAARPACPSPRFCLSAFPPPHTQPLLHNPPSPRQVKVDPNSQRLQLLTPFKAWDGKDIEVGRA